MTIARTTIVRGIGVPVLVAEDGTAHDTNTRGALLALASSVNDPWASVEATDTFAAAGFLTDNGTMAATEGGDSWSTSSGVEPLGIDSVYTTNGSTGYTSGSSTITTHGPDRILVLVRSAGTVNQTDGNIEVDRITAVSDSAGLTWKQASENVIGGDLPPDFRNSVIQIWWAFAHNKLTNASITITTDSHSSFTTNGLSTVFSVKGLNGNYNEPFPPLNVSDFGGSFGGYNTSTSGTQKPVTSDGSADSAQPVPIATGAGDGSRQPALVIEIESSFPGSAGGGVVGPPNSPAIGFTEILHTEQGGSQLTVMQSVNVAVINDGIKDATHNSGVNTWVTHPNSSTLWMTLWSTMYQGAQVPGQFIVTEITDGFVGVGHPGAFGVVGDLTVTGTPDTAIILGFERDSGVWASLESQDSFSAFIKIPITGHFTPTESADRFSAAGLGRGEDGVLISTEAVDIFSAIGHVPISGSFVTTDTTDRFVAIGAGVTQVRRRRQFFVT